MAMRLHELHAALVHFPITSMPTSVLADLVGELTGNEELKALGKGAMVATTASAALAGLSGLVAQQAVKSHSQTAHDMLTTHRTINIGVLGLSALLAYRRLDHAPGPGYFAAALGGLAALTYSAYLGGEMVYRHGVGVQRADGILRSETPELKAKNAGQAVKKSGKHIAQAVKHTAEHAKKGYVVPTLRDEPKIGPGE